MNHQASDTTILTFEDVRVPVEHIIGEEGMGFTYQMIQFQVGATPYYKYHSERIKQIIQEERLAAAAGCLVPLSTILEETIAYTKVFCLLHILHTPRFDIFTNLDNLLPTLIPPFWGKSCINIML